ncbi:hypothetical protein N0B31_02620 [Salinirubellus salinus]|uniref:Uncharacterized protein n=1 Tax=Salinirubellus salinus TaxID=1364945 RepID=A0A9E7R3Q4_9EURY|nr:hypothetical protein [Salinirubellus salinus]UWM55184.1 hypothetical protein N0B31_02620 [Salinirubellus salinus]
MRGADAGRRGRGQAHTLEGVVAALLLLASLVFALQSTAVTPLSASTSSQHIENQEQSMADGVLSIAEDDGDLLAAVVYWDETTESLHGIGGGGYANDGDYPAGFVLGDLLTESFSERGIAYNVFVQYRTADGAQRERRLVYRGVPSDNAVTASRVLTVYDDTPLAEADGSDDTLTVSDPGANFYMPDASPSTGTYNTVRVELTVWRM